MINVSHLFYRLMIRLPKDFNYNAFVRIKITGCAMAMISDRFLVILQCHGSGSVHELISG